MRGFILMESQPIQKEGWVERNNSALREHGFIIVDTRWYVAIIVLAGLGVLALSVLAVLAWQGKFQPEMTQSQTINPLFNATVSTVNEYRPTTQNQYDFKPAVYNYYNVTIPIQVKCIVGNSS